MYGLKAKAMGCAFRNVSMLVIVFCFVAGTVLGQQAVNSGSLGGRVTDVTGAVVAGASVTARNTDTHATSTATTDGQGRFQFANLPPGPYEITVSRQGFGSVTRSVTLTNEASPNLDFSLSPQALKQTVTVSAAPSSTVYSPPAQTVFSLTNQSYEAYQNTPATSISDVVNLIPGLTTIEGNGPRDVLISIRGSNNIVTYGVRNIKLYEDGFPVTQPDGLGRTDLIDPHAYGSVDVVEGPSSALYGNYATGGEINFHTRPGADIQGIQVGSDFGSFGYFNDYLIGGAGGANYDYIVFLSNTRAQGSTANTAYNTVTGNILATYALRPQDRVTVKFIDNELDTQLSLRLSLNQYLTNPYQKGCASLAVAGCASVSLYANGFNGAKVSLSPQEAATGRHDRRTIMGVRWEHDLSSNTTWRTQFVFDDRNIHQPTSSTSAIGPYPSFNVISDGTHHGTLFGRSAASYAGAFFNTEDISSSTYNVAPAIGGNATLGGITQGVSGRHLNTGVRAREELSLSPKWTVTGGIGFEYTDLTAKETIYAYPAATAPTLTLISADRTYYNIAPSAGLLFRASDAWHFHADLGTGYGTPQATNLFVTPQGTFGNNILLKSQKNTGVDVGVEWRRGARLRATLTGFYEWFHNELVTQSPGVNLQSYTFNAPASSHRGVEAGIDWQPLPTQLSGLGLRASYVYDNQIYTNYTEQLTSGSHFAAFSRDGNFIPGVVPNFFNSRVLYDQPSGRLRGFGGFFETTFRDDYYLDNANLIKAPGYTVLNANIHYQPARESRLNIFFEIENLANKTYVGTAGNITDSLNSTTGLENGATVLANSTGSIYAGIPRTSYGGVRISF